MRIGLQMNEKESSSHQRAHDTVRSGIVGLLIESEMRGDRRAEYGAQLVERLAMDLTKQFGRGFGSASLWRVRGFYQT
jgi:hypothetical protein